jgi:myo-inositol-1(or 4)-monophosphatase
MNKIDKKIKIVALRAAKLAGNFLLNEFRNFDRTQIQLKSHYEILTKADLGSERIILRELTKNFPHHDILSEESGDEGIRSEYLWIVDPLDGTTNFSIHNPLWSVSIALAMRGEIIFGLVHVPFLGETFIAELGGGAYRNKQKIRVSNIKGDRAFHTFCHGTTKENIKLALKYYQSQKLSKFDCRQLGSAAIELGYVACGRSESILIPGAHSWDVAAGALIAKEAGGVVTDFSGRAWNLMSKDLLATNGLVHEEILKMVR